MKKAWNKARTFFLKDLWAIDISPLGAVKGFLIQVLRVLAAITGDIHNGPLTLWAMSLVYTTLLSLVPLLAVSFSMLKAFDVHNKIEPLMINLLAPLGPKGAELSQKIIEFVSNMKVGVLGAVGLALLIYTVISLIQKIEEAFNALWRVRRMRSLLRRFSDYLSVILVVPVLVVAAIGFTATVLSTSLMLRLIAIEPIGTIVYYAGELVPYVLVCAAFTFVYMFVPNTRVKFSSALVGGVFGGVLWETIGWGFGSFVVASTHYSAVYSGFAILILFMIWLHVSWLILLVGAEVSFYHQNPQFLLIRNVSHTTDARLLERTAVSIMFLIGHHFRHNKAPWTVTSLAYRLGLSVGRVEDVLAALKRKGLIVETTADPPAYLPERDIEIITLREVYDAARGEGTGSDISGQRQIVSIVEVDRIVAIVEAAVGNALGEKTVKDIVRLHETDSEGRNA